MKQTRQTVSPMSNEGRNTYVIKQIREAFLGLLEDKSIEDISISELCNVAGVGRVSFYRNYERKEDILKSCLGEMLCEWTGQYARGTDAPLSEQVLTVFTHFENHRGFYELLYRRGLIYLLKDVILEIYGPEPDDEKTVAYAKAFVAYTIFGWIETWFARGMKETPDEIAELFKNQGL